jgi:hypothetical protein
VLRAVPGARVIGETAVRDEEHKVTIEGTALGTVR